MGFKCCVPLCVTGLPRYEKDPNVSIHKFPPSANLEQLNKWIRAIPRKWTDSELKALRTEPKHNYRVCSLHFQDKSIVTSSQDSNPRRKRPVADDQPSATLKNRRLTADAVPCIFPIAPSYLSRTSTPKRSTNLASAESRRENAMLRSEEVAMEFIHKDDITNFQALVSVNLPDHLQCFHKQISASAVTFFITRFSLTESLKVAAALTVSETLCFEVTIDGDRHASFGKDLASDGKLHTISQMENILARLKNYDLDETELGYEQHLLRAQEEVKKAILDLSLKLESNSSEDDSSAEEAAYAKLSFLVEQLSMTSLSRKRHAYSQELLAFAYLMQHHSPSAYRFIQASNTVSLPSVRHLQRLSSCLSNDPDVKVMEEYLNLKVRDLQESEKVVLLAIDEIYSSKRMEFCGGHIFGNDVATDELAKTVCAFMIKSLRGDFQEVISLIPKSQLNAHDLHKHLLDCLTLLDRVGLKPVVCIVDNNPVNRSLFQGNLCKGQMQPSIVNPVSGEPLFLLFDPVHNFKNILNNWISRQVFQFPDFADPQKIQTADFSELHKLYETELHQPARIAHKLSRRSLNPTNLERTSVQHAANTFSESTIEAAKFYNLSTGLITFMQLIFSMWTIWNIKTTSKAKEKRLPDAAPLLPNDQRLNKLRQFAIFFRRWEESRLPGFTAPTFLAVRSCCLALAGLAEHLFSRYSFPSVLPGRIVSDWIEKRFGRYRQFHGGNFYVSVRQIFQAEKKIRVSSLLTFHGINLKDLQSLDQTCSSEFLNPLLPSSLPCIEYLDAALSPSDRNLCCYLGGYVSKSVCAQLKCADCKSLLTTEDYLDLVAEDGAKDRTLIQMRDRCGLKCPSEFVFFLMKSSYFVFGHLRDNRRITADLQYSGRAVQRIVELCQEYIRNSSECRNILDQICNCGRSATSLTARVLTPSVRIYMKNFVNMSNDNAKNNKPLKRKLLKFSDG